MERLRHPDQHDALRFCPLQSPAAQRLCEAYDVPCDFSTGIFVEVNDKDNNNTCSSQAYVDSTGILRMLLLLQQPWAFLGMVALWVPKFFRDACYRAFARNRGTIWKTVKRVTGMGDTRMHAYRTPYVVGLEELPTPLPSNFGFDSTTTNTTTNQSSIGSGEDTVVEIKDQKNKKEE